ncbi:ADP/ATP carrier protein [Trichoderma cornu-damae]|uniref:ADP/ATP translocase n=1 Tax=Trichoderma cornu-damae TaxID=654480 RepID=A0A9P8QMZ8_9HYPO|nr:ADP/ATP carrier protein [Trichoderma cornu-damae]
MQAHFLAVRSKRRSFMRRTVTVTLSSAGIVGLYHGFTPSVLSAVIYRDLYLVTYDSFKTTFEFKSSYDAAKQIITKNGARALFSDDGGSSHAFTFPFTIQSLTTFSFNKAATPITKLIMATAQLPPES